MEFWHKKYSGNVAVNNVLASKQCQIIATVVACAQLCILTTFYLSSFIAVCNVV